MQSHVNNWALTSGIISYQRTVLHIESKFLKFSMRLPDHALLTSGKCRLQLHSEVHEKCKLQPLPHSQFPGSKCSENTVWPHRKGKERGSSAHHLQTVGISKGKKTFSMVEKKKSIIYAASNETYFHHWMLCSKESS